MVEVFCDGGSRNNPGHAAYGFVVKVNGQTIKKDGQYIGIATNNVAEYTAVVEALLWLENKYKGEEVNFNLDSNLVVSQLTGVFKIKNADLGNFVVKIRSLENSFKKINYKYIPREKNKEADLLVNSALDKKLYGI
jgi:ribonuclease HI